MKEFYLENLILAAVTHRNEKLYVDNAFDGAHYVTTMKKHETNSVVSLKTAGFALCKWSPNDP